MSLRLHLTLALLLSASSPRSALSLDADSGSCLRQHLSQTGDREEDALLDAWRDTGHFRVHYATSGPNMVYGWPATASVDSACVYLEEAYRVFHQVPGFAPALSDGARGGGQDLYDCYLLDTGPHGAGYASGEYYSSSPCDGSVIGYCAVENDFGGFWEPDVFRSALAHEYFHLVQFAAAADQSSWFMESTAVWAERAVKPSYSGYSWRMPNWFWSPQLGVWGLGHSLRKYGSAHFWCFLEENTDSAFLPAVFQRCCSEGWLDAVKEELVQRGMDFDAALVRFSLWNNATGIWDDRSHYRQGRAYPEISCQAVRTELPVLGDTLAANLIAGPAGFNYIRFLGPGGRDSLRLSFDGAPDLRDVRTISFALQRTGQPQREWTLDPDENGDVSLAISGWSACDQVTMIVTNFVGAAGDLTFRYAAREVGSVAPRWLGDLGVSPNPFSSETRLSWRVEGDARPVSLLIFEASGRRLLHREVTGARTGDQIWWWNGRDEDGREVPAGVYLVRITTPKESLTTRLVRVR